MDNLAPAVSPPAGIGDAKPSNQSVLDWVQDVAKLTEPETIFWCDGSEKENAWLLEQAQRLGVVLKLSEQKKPGSYLHRSNPNDVARVEQFTLICTPTKEEAGPTNNWAAPAETYTKLHEMLRGAMRGRTMFVVPYIMGPPDSPLTKVGFEITDSIYVVLSMRIMTRMGTVAVKRLGDNPSGEWNRGVHSLLDVNPDRRLICHFPQDNAILSVGSGYGGNVLLSKKCLALRIGSYLARKQGWLAEHMLILGVESPAGKKHYVAAAFPSACGKTNFAMLIPPKHFAGWKVTTVGDDIAWMQIRDGRLWAVNPENGYFGVVPGTSYKANPNAMRWIRMSRKVKECQSARSFSADAAAIRRRWFIRRSIGLTLSTSVQRWLRKQPRPPPAQWVRSDATRWRCCHSADTTSGIISSTGSIFEKG